MLKPGFLICFTGVDGSGKTTHAKHLLAFFKEKGLSSEYVWAGSRPVLLYLFLGTTRILGYWKKLKRGDWMDPLEKAPPRVREKMGVLLRFLLFVDFEITTSLKVRLPLLQGKIVLCDRYVYDLLMDLMLCGLCTQTFGRLVLGSVPACRIVFFTDAKSGALVHRRPGSNWERVTAKRNVYRKLAKIFQFRTIDTLMGFEANQEQIRKEVVAFLGEST